MFEKLSINLSAWSVRRAISLQRKDEEKVTHHMSEFVCLSSIIAYLESGNRLFKKKKNERFREERMRIWYFRSRAVEFDREKGAVELSLIGALVKHFLVAMSGFYECLHSCKI